MMVTVYYVHCETERGQLSQSSSSAAAAAPTSVSNSSSSNSSNNNNKWRPGWRSETIIHEIQAIRSCAATKNMTYGLNQCYRKLKVIRTIGTIIGIETASLFNWQPRRQTWVMIIIEIYIKRPKPSNRNRNNLNLFLAVFWNYHRDVNVLWRVHWHSRLRRDVHWSSLRCRRPQRSNGPSWWRDNRASRPGSLWPWTRPPSNVANSRPWRPSERRRYQGRSAAACSGRSRCRSFWSSPSSVVCSS